MKTWIVIYKEKGETKSKLIMARTFDDVISEMIWNIELVVGEIKAIIEVAK